ncbi:MAG: hypothetical protein IT306_18095 [Chloroflexi bacterium]|nr:hypothetical protein [Chloroflexota bacterium]
MTEILFYATPVGGTSAGVAAGTIFPAPGSLLATAGPILAVVMGLLILGWLVWRALMKPVPMDVHLPETRVPGDQLTRERFRPRASELLGRRSRF